MKHEGDGDTNCNWWSWIKSQRLGKLEELEIRGRAEPIQTTDRPEYREESWRLEETCYHSHPSERPSANAGIKKIERSKITVVTYSKGAQDRLACDVLGVLTSFGSSNIILALPSDPTETIVPAGDPAVKSLPSTQNRTAHTSNNQNASGKELLNWNWPMTNDIRHFPPSRDESKR